MSFIFGICEKCNRGYLVPHTKMYKGPDENEFIINNASKGLDIALGPCPDCGGMVMPPKGLIKLSNSIFEVIHNSGHTKEEYERLISLFVELKDENPDVEKVEKVLEQNLPEALAYLKGFLTPANVLSSIAIIIAVLTYTKNPESGDTILHHTLIQPLILKTVKKTSQIKIIADFFAENANEQTDKVRKSLNKMVGRARFELATIGLKVRCSTN